MFLISNLCILLKLEDIKIPLSRGTIADLADDIDVSGSQSSSLDASAQGSKEIYEKEAKIKVNYNRLDAELKEVIFYLRLKYVFWLTSLTFF